MSTDAVTSFNPSSAARAVARPLSYGSIAQAPVTSKTVRTAPDDQASALPAAVERVENDLHPQNHDPDRRSDYDDCDRRQVGHLLERVPRHRRAGEPHRQHDEDHRHD